MPVTAVVLKAQDGSHNLRVTNVQPTRCRLWLIQGYIQPPSALESPHRVGYTPILAYTTYSCRVTHATPRTYSQPGSPVTWVHSGLSHMVPCSGTQAGTHSYRVTHKRTQSHGHTQSHGRTQAHTQAHAPAGHTCSATSCCWLFRPPCLHANSCP